MKIKMWFFTATVFLVMSACPAVLAAQHTRYKLIDIGTLGGPNSSLASSFTEGVSAASLNNAGTFAGNADTFAQDPFAPNCFSEGCKVSHAVKARKGVITDLGSLAGPDFSSAATWISSNGLIVGLSQNGFFDPLNFGLPEVRAVLWNQGKMLNLGTLDGGHESVAFAVNSRGQVAGFAANGVQDPASLLGFTTQTRGFLWQNGKMQDLGALDNSSDAVALLINEAGQVVGQSYTNESTLPTQSCNTELPRTLHGFLWENGALTDIGTLGGSCAFVYALNNRGQVVGQSTVAGDVASHPYIWERGTITDLGTLGGSYGFAAWINDAGRVVGSVTNASDAALLAVVWKDGVITGLGTLPGDACSAANVINSKGQIVGGSGLFAPFFSACANDTVEHAFLWQDGAMVDLNAFVPPDSDLTLSEAVFINDAGEISGIAALPTGEQHAFLLVPCEYKTELCRDADDNAIANRRSRAVPQDRLVEHQLGSIRKLLKRQLSGEPATQVATSMNAITTSILTTTLSTTSLAFSAQALATTSLARTVTLTTSATATLTISSIAISGINAGDFMQTNNCGSALVGSCTISITFKPKVIGPRSAVLNVTDNASGSPQHVSLSGIGTTAKLSPATLMFGTTAIGVTSASKTVMLTNIGTSTFSIYGISITGTNTGSFSQTHSCGSSLSAGASCGIYVRFKPTASGTRTAALSVSDSAAGTPQTVSLTGVGTTAKLSPTSLNFGSITSGSVSAAKSVTLTNVGSSTLSISAVAITGTNTLEFNETSNCGLSLLAGASCNISVVFRPLATNKRAAVLSVSDNGTGSPQGVALTGTGAGGTCTSNPPTNFSSFAFRRGLYDVVHLSWTDHAIDEDSYHVERCTGSTCTNFGEIAVLGGNVISYYSGVWPQGLTFRYRVRAHCSGGYSGYSNIRTQTTP
jgi:probable HAF family extracellular repeat protein